MIHAANFRSMYGWYTASRLVPRYLAIAWAVTGSATCLPRSTRESPPGSSPTRWATSERVFFCASRSCLISMPIFCVEHNPNVKLFCVMRFAPDEKAIQTVKMKELGKVIRAMRQERSKTPDDVAGVIDGFDAGSLSRFERGKQGIATDKLAAIADVLGVPLSSIYAHAEGRNMDNAVTGPDIYGRVPLLSSVQAGQWGETMEAVQTKEIDVWVPTTANVSANAYALRITGDSMEPLLPNGSIVVVDPDVQPVHGKIVVVRQSGGEATVKKLVVDGNKQFLQPINPRYPIMESGQDAVFCGVVRQVVLDL